MCGGGGQNLVEKYYKYFSSSFIALLSFAFILSVFINFYYYELYKTNIDIFVFGILDDNTKAIFGIIFEDYPIWTLLLVAFVFSAFCVWWNVKLSKFKSCSPPLFEKLSVILPLLLIFLVLYVLALRGPYRYVAMNVNTYRFSKLENFNALVLNPLMSFSFALKQYKRERIHLNPADMPRLETLQKELFPLFETSPKNTFALENKPHIMVNLMESFGSQMLSFQNANLNLLGELGKHFEQDFVWNRFLPCANGTALSLSCLFFSSPIAVSQSKYTQYYLPWTPIEIYKQQGYKVIFLTAETLSWQNIGNFMKAQEVDLMIDQVTLLEEFPDAIKNHATDNVADEFMYDKAFEILQNAKEPLLILALTTSNHPPFLKVKEYITKEQIPDELSKKIPKNAHTIINAFVYANDEFGKFLTKVKSSALKDNLIVAATGDHRVRYLDIDFKTEKALANAVPFYLYVPKAYQEGIIYDKMRIGSHKDIFPTLYALSLSEVKYLNIGGRNLLGQIENEKFEFGYNQSVWIDKEEIYPKSSDIGYRYFDDKSLLSIDESFVLDEEHLQFHKLYTEFLDMQLRYRLLNLREKRD